MSDNVVGLRGQKIFDPRVPIKDVVDAAEDLAERARTGEIKGLVAAYIYFDEGTGEQAAGQIHYALMGRLDSLKDTILKQLKK